MSGKEARLAHLEARADEFDELIGRHAARFASFFELFDEMRGASRSAHGRIDNLQNRIAHLEARADEFDERIGRLHATADGRIDKLLDRVEEAETEINHLVHLVHRLEEVETAIDDIRGPEFTDGSPDLPPVAERRPLYLVVSNAISPLMDDPAAVIQTILSDSTEADRERLAVSEFAPSDDFEGWRGEGSHLYEVRGDQVVHQWSTPGLTPPYLGDLEVRP